MSIIVIVIIECISFKIFGLAWILAEGSTLLNICLDGCEQLLRL
jgi:hypothetical protein